MPTHFATEHGFGPRLAISATNCFFMHERIALGSSQRLSGRSWRQAIFRRSICRSILRVKRTNSFGSLEVGVAQGASTTDFSSFPAPAMQQNNVGLFDFLQTFDQKQLPDNARIAVVGIEAMAASWAPYFVDRIQFCGWLCKPDFHKLLVQARAVLVPQAGGFGCITPNPRNAHRRNSSRSRPDSLKCDRAVAGCKIYRTRARTLVECDQATYDRTASRPAGGYQFMDCAGAAASYARVR